MMQQNNHHMLSRIFLFFFIFLIACNKPACENKNPVFDNNPVGSAVYNAELKMQMETRPDIHYWVDGYEENNGRQYIKVEIQGKDMRAHAAMDITESESFASVKEVKGSGYSGAELKGVKYRTENTGNGETFVIEDVETISD